MAIRFATAGDMLDTTAGAPDNTSTTFVAWVNMASNTATNASIIRIRTAANALVTEFGTRVDGVTMRINSNGTTLNGTYIFTPGVWSKVACSVAGTTGTNYGADGQSNTVTSNTGALTAGTAARFAIGGRGNADATGLWNGRVAGVKLYNRVLTLDEIRTEWTQILPVSTAGLYAAYPLDSGDSSGLLDYSGSGRSLGAGSTLTDDGPPIPRQRVIIRPYHGHVGATTGVLAGSLGALTLGGTWAATSVTPGVLAGSLGALSLGGAWTATAVTPGVLEGPLGALPLGGEWTGTTATSGALEGALDALSLEGRLTVHSGVAYPIRAAAVTDLSERGRAGAITDLATRHRAGTPT